MERARNRQRIVRLFVCLFARVRPRIKPRIKPCYTAKPSTKLLMVVIHCHLQQQSPKDHKNRSKSFWSTSSCLLLGCKSKTFMENAFDSFMARVEKLWLGSVTDPSRKEKWLAAPALPLSLSPFLSSLRVILARSLSLSLSPTLSISVPLYFSMNTLSPIFTFSQVPGQIKCSSIEVLNIRQSLLRLQFNQRTCFEQKTNSEVTSSRLWRVLPSKKAKVQSTPQLGSLARKRSTRSNFTAKCQKSKELGKTFSKLVLFLAFHCFVEILMLMNTEAFLSIFSSPNSFGLPFIFHWFITACFHLDTHLLNDNLFILGRLLGAKRKEVTAWKFSCPDKSFSLKNDAKVFKSFWLFFSSLNFHLHPFFAQLDNPLWGDI